MAITRTAIIDDDGSGTTGTVIDNAWKQEFYNQIDALAGSAGLWTPTDASGAGLALTVYDNHWTRAGQAVTLTAYIVYPSTANGAAAKIGGLPFASIGYSGFVGALITSRGYMVSPGGTVIEIFNGTTGAALTNAQVSAVGLIFSGTYLAS